MGAPGIAESLLGFLMELMIIYVALCLSVSKTGVVIGKETRTA
jgi:hypothetical protein